MVLLHTDYYMEGKEGGGRVWGKDNDIDFDMMSLGCLLHVQLEMFQRKLEMGDWESAKRLGKER